MTVYIFDVFFPDYLKLDKTKESDVELYEKKIQEIMAKCLHTKTMENVTYKENWEYFYKINDLRKELFTPKNKKKEKKL